MKMVVIDTNELMRDWLFGGLKYQIIERMRFTPWIDIRVPSLVVEELVANHARAQSRVRSVSDQIDKDRRNLGLPPVMIPTSDFQYRAFLTESLEERLGITIMPWPTASHSELVARAVSRRPPFDEKGGGYRDSLIWHDVVELVRAGHDVALVSMDNTFADSVGKLAAQLAAEVTNLAGSVELVRDFNSWLLAALPWTEIPDLETALKLSRTSEFYDYYLHSDFQNDLQPSVEEIGFRWSPIEFEIDEVTWDGGFDPIEGATAEGNGLSLVEYDLGQRVDFRAVFPEGAPIEEGWDASPVDMWRRFEVSGTIEMVLRIAVLYGGEFGWSIEALAWRRFDGAGLGAPLYRPEDDPDQPSLFEES